MNISYHPKYLPFFAIGTGLLGLLLRLWLLQTGLDDKGLLVANHPANYLVWILSVAVVACLFFGTWGLRGAPKYSFNFPAFIPGGAGTILAAVGILICTVAELAGNPDGFGFLMCIFGFLAAMALVFTGCCRCTGAHPSPIFHTVASIYLLLRLVWMYRQWSADPQMQDYAFQLLALVCLMLACHHRSAFDANMGSRRAYAGFSLAALYFCIVALPGCDSMAFFLACTAWMGSNLCALIPMPKEPAGED